MDIKRKSPRKEQRAPGEDSEEALIAYNEVVQRIFQNSGIKIDKNSINENELKNDLSIILRRRKKYFPPDDGLEKLN